MTKRLYQHDSYLQSFSGTVTGHGTEGVTLDQTAFFPSGGGVLGDEGVLTAEDGSAFTVTETVDWEGAVLHRIEGALPTIGTPLNGKLDWARRYMLMRYHTATHVLTGVMFKDYGVKVTGNQLTPLKGRVDFSFEAFDRAVLEAGFEKSNALVKENREVRISFIPQAEAQNRPELFKLETAFRHNVEEIRLVDIVDFDIQADGGCHVAKLGEIGSLRLTKSENKGKANRRVYFELEA